MDDMNATQHRGHSWIRFWVSHHSPQLQQAQTANSGVRHDSGPSHVRAPLFIIPPIANYLMPRSSFTALDAHPHNLNWNPISSEEYERRIMPADLLLDPCSGCFWASSTIYV